MHALAPIALVVGLFAQLGPGRGPRPYVPRGEVTIADPIVKSAGGKVDRTIVKRYLRRELAKFRYCYERALQVNPALGGVLRVQFRVLADGRVARVRVEGVANDIENCVAGVVRRLRLPRLPEEGEVRTRLTLKPGPRRAPIGRRGGGCVGVGCGTIGR